MTKTDLTVPPGLIVTIGLPGSGKTTWTLLRVNAGPDTVARANRDALRIAQSGQRRGSRRQEKAVSLAQDALIRANFAAGYTTVIVDDTNLHGVGRFKTLAEELGVALHVQDFRQVPLATCIRRDSLRDGHERVGEDVIRRMHDDHVVPYFRRLADEKARARAGATA